MKYQKKDVIAMILAGGQGTRLKELTKKLAKPAVPFGGKYRIIDFTLSNCSNSGIDTVGVLTQYHPLELNAHIGSGRSWDLNINTGGIYILPPYVGMKGGRWYKGTANAVYENFDFIDIFEPNYILILSGDHIYKMNYNKMINYHKKKGADVTLSVIEVPYKDASRFGVVNTNKEGVIINFEEKAEHPSSNKASMGVYIFNYEVLKKYLIEDENNKLSSNDFGKDILPKMVKNKEKLFAYNFDGYWKDVGTIESLWEANMDLLNESNKLNLYDKSWKIYSHNPYSPPPYISQTGNVQSSLLNEGCIIYGNVINSILFPDVYIEKGAKIIDSVIMPNVKIEEGVIINRAIVMSGVIITKGRIINKQSNEIQLITGF